MQAYDSETLTVTNAVKTPTAAKLVRTPTLGTPQKAAAVMISTATDDIRYTFHGGDPSATVGHLLSTTSAPVLIKGAANVANLRMFRVTTDASVTLTYLV
jgi:hypothetical protein